MLLQNLRNDSARYLSAPASLVEAAMYKTSPSRACIYDPYCQNSALTNTEVGTHIPRIRHYQQNLFQSKNRLLIHSLRDIQVRQLCPGFCIGRRGVEELIQCCDSFSGLLEGFQERDSSFRYRLERSV